MSAYFVAEIEIATRLGSIPTERRSPARSHNTALVFWPAAAPPNYSRGAGAKTGSSSSSSQTPWRWNAGTTPFNPARQLDRPRFHCRRRDL